MNKEKLDLLIQTLNEEEKDQLLKASLLLLYVLNKNDIGSNVKDLDETDNSYIPWWIYDHVIAILREINDFHVNGNLLFHCKDTIEYMLNDIKRNKT